MAKLTQKTYIGYNLTIKSLNYDTMEVEEKTCFISATNPEIARKLACKHYAVPEKAITSIERIAETLVVDTTYIDEVFRKYGRKKSASDKDDDIE